MPPHDPAREYRALEHAAIDLVRSIEAFMLASDNAGTDVAALVTEGERHARNALRLAREAIARIEGRQPQERGDCDLRTTEGRMSFTGRGKRRRDEL